MSSLSFKVGFLTKLAEAGITPGEFDELVKDKMNKQALLSGVLLDALKGGAAAAIPLAAAGAAVPPVLAGIIAGHTAANVDAPNSAVVEEDQARDLRDHYKLLALKALAAQQSRQTNDKKTDERLIRVGGY